MAIKGFSDDIINIFKPVHCPQCSKPMRKAYETEPHPIIINHSGEVTAFNPRDKCKTWNQEKLKCDHGIREIKFTCDYCDGWILFDLIVKGIC